MTSGKYTLHSHPEAYCCYHTDLLWYQYLARLLAWRIFETVSRKGKAPQEEALFMSTIDMLLVVMVMALLFIASAWSRKGRREAEAALMRARMRLLFGEQSRQGAGCSRG